MDGDDEDVAIVEDTVAVAVAVAIIVVVEDIVSCCRRYCYC